MAEEINQTLSPQHSASATVLQCFSIRLFIAFKSVLPSCDKNTCIPRTWESRDLKQPGLCMTRIKSSLCILKTQESIFFMLVLRDKKKKNLLYFIEGDNDDNTVPSFYQVGARAQTQVFRLSGKNLNQLSHLFGQGNQEFLIGKQHDTNYNYEGYFVVQQVQVNHI